MGKGKKGGGGGGGGGEGEEKENKENENAKKFLDIVLKIDLHCEGCTTKIKKQILKFPGVVMVEFEGENKAKIMAQKSVDPSKLRERLQNKTLKMTELVSPKPSKNDEKKNDKNNDKPKEVPVTTVVLKVDYHCQGCGDRLYKTVSSFKGVHEVVIDKEKNTVKVTGRLEAKQLVEELQKKLKKRVEIANDKKGKGKQNEKGNEEDGKKDENNEGGGGGGSGGGGGGDKKQVKIEYLVNGSGYVGICDGSGRVLEIFDTPQFLSDENPNACTIM